MDGNGRWAQQRMLRRIVGHQKGAETVNMVVEHAWRLGIPLPDPVRLLLRELV
jgi:undecaprenyl diphosphate synthase